MPKRTEGSPLRRWLRRPLLWLLLAAGLCTLALTPPAIDIVDARFRVQAVESLLQGRTDVTPDPAWPGYFVRGDDGRHRTIYGIGQLLVLTPVVAAADLLFHGEAEREGAIAWASVLLQSVLLALALYACLRAFGLRPGRAAAWSLLLYFATPCLIWARSMQEEGLLGAACTGALALALHARRRRDLRLLAWAGLAAGFALTVRPYAALVLLALAVWLVSAWGVGRWRALGITALGMLPGIVAMAVWNMARSGNPLRSGWEASGGTAGWNFSTELLFHQLISFNGGVMMFAPALWLLMRLFIAPLPGSRLRPGLLAALLFAAGAGMIVLFSGLPQYVGHNVGVSWGPRYPAHLVIALTPLLALACLAGRRHNGMRATATVLLTISLAVQLAGASFHPNLEIEEDRYRARHSLPEASPHDVLPRRVANIGRWVAGDLQHSAFPGAEGDEAVDARILSTPEIAPLRMTASRRAPEKESWARRFAWGAWLCAVVGGAASAWLVFRRRKGVDGAA